MQPVTLPLSVDVENNGVPVEQVLTRYEEDMNRTVYIGPGHLPDSRNMMTIYRTFPVRNGNFKGTSKSSIKFTEDRTVPGVDSNTLLSAPMIIEVNFSIPIGVNAERLKEARQRVIAALDLDTFMDALNLQLRI